MGQDAGEQMLLDEVQQLSVQLLRISVEAIGDECIPVGAARLLRGLGGGERWEEVGQEDRPRRPQQRLLQHALQLAQVSRPAIAAQDLQRLRGHRLHSLFSSRLKQRRK